MSLSKAGRSSGEEQDRCGGSGTGLAVGEGVVADTAAVTVAFARDSLGCWERPLLLRALLLLFRVFLAFVFRGDFIASKFGF